MAYVITEPCIDVKDATCVDVCPVNAIFHEDDVPPEWKPDIEKNRLYFQEHGDLGAAFRQRSERR